MIKYLFMICCRFASKLLIVFVIFSLLGIGSYFAWPRGKEPAETKGRTVERADLKSSSAGPRKAKAPGGRESWAKAISRPGLPNLHKINDRLYRGGQPEKEGYAELVKLGVKTIVCLRTDDEDSEHLGDLPLRCVHLSITLTPTREQVVEFLKVATDKKRQPVYFHCKYGSDRTGTMCAMYRIAVEGWSKQAAIEEMTKGGFGYHWWTGLTKFVQGIDVDWLREKAGLTKKGQGAEQ
jgi:tyrosine-protein phosphatase SIW14